MFKRFLSGFMTCFPFISLSDKNIRYFPKEIYHNDWKTISDIIRKIIKSDINNKSMEKNE